MSDDTKPGIAEMLRSRGMTHGDFTDHARVTQTLKDVLHAEPTWGTLSSIQKEALEMIVHKIGRIMAGDPNHVDHWADIAGYAKITADRLLEKDKPNYKGSGKQQVQQP